MTRSIEFSDTTGVLGLRWSEVAGLKVGRVDFLRRTITVVETVDDVGGRVVVADVKTRSSRRTVSVPQVVLVVLAEHMARLGIRGPDEYLFTAPGAGPVRYHNFRHRVWLPATAAVGLGGLTFDGLRYAATSMMAQAGVDIATASKRLGHSSVRVTADVYLPLVTSVDQEAAARLGAIMEAATRVPTGEHSGRAQTGEGKISTG